MLREMWWGLNIWPLRCKNTMISACASNFFYPIRSRKKLNILMDWTNIDSTLASKFKLKTEDMFYDLNDLFANAIAIERWSPTTNHLKNALWKAHGFFFLPPSFFDNLIDFYWSGAVTLKHYCLLRGAALAVSFPFGHCSYLNDIIMVLPYPTASFGFLGTLLAWQSS